MATRSPNQISIIIWSKMKQILLKLYTLGLEMVLKSGFLKYGK